MIFRTNNYLIVIVAVLFLLGISNLEAKKQSLKGRAQTDYRSAQISMQHELYDKALDQYLRVLNNAPDHVESIKNIADLYFLNAEYAEEDFEARERYSKANEYYHRVLKVINGLKDWKSYDNFETIKDDAEKKTQSIWVRIFNMGREAYLAEDYDESEKIMNYVLQLDPSRGEPYLLLANIADKRGDDEKKMEYFLSLLEIAKDNTQVIINIAIDYRDKKDWENAKKYFGMFIEAEPNNVAGFVELAFVYVQLNNYKDALLNYEKALAIEPTDVDILINAANVAGELNDQAKFIDLFKRVIEVDKTVENVEFLCNRLARYQNWQELITYCKIWHELDPKAKDPVQLIIFSAQQTRNEALRKEFQDKLSKM